MKDLLTWLSRRRYPYQPLITVRISRGRLLYNLEAFRQAANELSPGLKVAPVLKSNAYGHGLFEIAEILAASDGSSSIPFFAVDSYFEAVALRAHGLKTPILIIGYNRPETLAHSKLEHTAFAVTSLDILKQLHPDAPPCPEAEDVETQGPASIPRRRQVGIHLKIDTGMRRQGIMPDEVDEAVRLIKENPGLVLEGVFTHFSDTEDPDESFTEGQIHLWNHAATYFRSAFPHLRYWHASATDGIRFSKDIQANVMRLGIGLYGLAEGEPLNERVAIEPVLEMRTILSGVKKLKVDETVGYANTFKARNDMQIATVPVGYYEGLDRRMSSRPDGDARAFIQVGAERIACPIIGRVSMNITTIDVSAVPKAIAGMEAVVVSKNAGDSNSIASIARACGTITYEVAVRIPAHLKRVVVE